jgi:hypothetical protein
MKFLKDLKELYITTAPKADFEFWKSLELWTLMEGTHLLHGFEPGHFSNRFFSDFEFSSYYPRTVHEMYRSWSRLKKDLITGKLAGTEEAIRSEDLIKWATENGVAIPSELRKLSPKKEKKFVYPEEVVEVIKQAKPEMIYLYEFMMSIVEESKGYSPKAVKDATMEIFQDKKWTYLKEEYVGNNHLYNKSAKKKLRRKFLGKLTQIILHLETKELPNLHVLKANYGSEKLYDALFKKLETDSLKSLP